jgi:hypothetical protein
MSIKHAIYALTVLCVLLPGLTIAQNEVPNASFEMWSGTDPDFWDTFNENGDPNVTPDADAYDGTIAARLEVISGNTFPPRMQAHNGSNAPFPVSQSYNYLTGYYKYSPVGGDVTYIYVGLNGGIGEGGKEGFLEITDQASVWTQFVIPIIEYQAGPINEGVISFQMENLPNLHEGTWFLVDDLELLMDLTSVEDETNLVNDFTLEQNYPNPFNPSTKISWQSQIGSHQTLKIYDVLGNEVITLVDEYKPAGSYEVEFDASGLTSGIYFYKLIAGTFLETKKMMLLK